MINSWVHELIRLRRHLYFILLFFISTNFAQQTDNIGTLPFDWSGQNGIYHRYGFPGWGVDVSDGPLFIDGNFSHWIKRYAFPFESEKIFVEGENVVESTLRYRTGDYFLDELAVDLNFQNESNHHYRLQALKRNFEDQYGLIGPVKYSGGTIQQNYKLLFKIPKVEGEEWEIGSAYYRTSDAVPTEGQIGWSKSFERVDRIFSNGISYNRETNSFRFVQEFAAFSQRLKLISQSDIPGWQADLISYKFHNQTEYLRSEQASIFADINLKYSQISSGSLGNQNRTDMRATVGIKQQAEKLKYQVGMGSGYVNRNNAFIYKMDAVYSNESFQVIFDTDRSIVSLPFQWSGKNFLFIPREMSETPFQVIVPNSLYVPRVTSENSIPTIFPDTSAISQVRTLSRVRVAHQSKRAMIKAGYFISYASPHYFFKKLEMSEDIVLKQETSGSLNGFTWQLQLNYFRNWWIETEGISFIRNKEGWGNGTQHQMMVSLKFQEYLFSKHMDARVRIWSDIWIGRNDYVWNPALQLGYYDYNDVYLQNVTGIVNAEFKGVISNFEISYTMTNMLYAFRNLLSSQFQPGQLTLKATPFLPPPGLGRLFYITIQWNFKD